jgi:hypothetical protein
MHMKRSQHAALDSGDTAFVMVCSVLVLLMTLPGLMLFYGAFCARGAIPRQFSFARICVRQRHRRSGAGYTTSLRVCARLARRTDGSGAACAPSCATGDPQMTWALRWCSSAFARLLTTCEPAG